MNISSNTEKIERLFSGVDTRYVVPHYQRDYSWTPDNIAELWADITNAWEGGSEYFMGTIVLNSEFREQTAALEIVDGQQRLATFTILISIVRDLCKRFLDDPNNPVFVAPSSQLSSNQEKASRAYRKAENLILHVAEPDNYFMQLNEKDQPRFHAEIQTSGRLLLAADERRLVKSESRIIKSKKVLTSKIIESFLGAADAFVKLDHFLTFCMTRLLFLRIDVTSDTDAYLLFETLNDRGLDLSISDLVKNRLLITCGADHDKRKRVLTKWEQIVDGIDDSRYQAHDFLRFYWSAFYGSVTKKEIYSKIKRHLVQAADPEPLVDSLLGSAEYFGAITGKGLRYPAGESSYAPASVQQAYAEINALGYSVCYPFLLSANARRPDLVPQVIRQMIAYLFRLISIGGFAAGRAEQAFNEAMRKMQGGEPLNAILECFRDDEITDGRFRERVINGSFEDNKFVRYFLAKLHDHEFGTAYRLTTDVHVEHVLPVKHERWVAYDTAGKAIEEWVYSIGNFTLLEKGLNQRIQNDIFPNKVPYFRRREGSQDADAATSIPMTYRIHEAFAGGRAEWTADWIQERANHFANLAVAVWPFPCAQVDIQI